MVQPAMQLSAKIPDNYVQLWAASLLRGTHFACFSAWLLSLVVYVVLYIVSFRYF